ncbi:MAG: hypothetical protein QOJ45_2296 [Verrucomicrobiota bacterium]
MFRVTVRAQSLACALLLCLSTALSGQTIVGPNDRLYQERSRPSSDDSPFGSDWQILSNHIFFGGAQGLFGLSPASFLRRPRSLIESSADGIVAAETSAPNEAFLSLPNEVFLSVGSSDSPFIGPRSSSPNATRLSGATSLVPAAPLADSQAALWDGGPSGSGNTWQNPQNWQFDAGPPGGHQIAQFGSAGFISLIVIDMTNIGPNQTNHGGANQIVGAIELLSGTREIGSQGAGTLTLDGATVNGVANVILLNASAGQLTLQWPPFAMDVALGEFSPDNVIVIDGSGNITISGVIKTPGPAAGHITLTGAGTGALVLTGNNTYTGGTTIAAGTIQINSATSLGNQSGTATIGNGIVQATANITTTRNFQLSDANSRISVDAGRTFTISGLLSDGATAGTLNKIGTGDLILSGNNTYTGGTTINAGTIRAGSTTAIGPAASAALAFGSGSTGKFQLFGFDTTVVGFNSNATVGTPVVENGAAGTATLTVDGTGINTFAGVLRDGTTGILALTKSGNGTLTLKGTNTYTGDTQINGGDLRFDSGGTVSGSIIRLGDTSGSNYAVLSLGFVSGNNLGSTLEVRTGSSGTKVLRSLDGAGTNTYSGGITLNTGLTLEATTNGTLLLEGGSVNLQSNTLTIDSQVVNAPDGPNGADADASRGTVRINEVVSGSGGSVVKDGSGTLILQGISNTYTGGTTIKGGTLGIYGDGGLGTAPDTAADNIFFAASAASNPTATRILQSTNGDVTLGATRNINIAAGVTGTFDSNSNTFIIGGVINGTGNLTKIGAGTLTLNGNNTYAGITTVSAGTLLVNGNQSAAIGAVTVSNSGTTLGGNGTIGGTVTVNSGANLSPGNSPGILNTGSLTLNSGSNYLVELNNPTAGTGYDQTVVTGSVSLLNLSATTLPNLVLTIGGTFVVGDKFFVILNDSVDPVVGTFAQGATVTSGSYTFLIDYFADSVSGNLVGGNDILLEVTAVPEPSTWIGGALALGAIGLMTRNSRRAHRLPRRP